MHIPDNPRAAVDLWAKITGVDRADLSRTAQEHGLSLEAYCMQRLANHQIVKAARLSSEPLWRSSKNPSSLRKILKTKSRMFIRNSTVGCRTPRCPEKQLQS
jgi:hypothetical protein